MGKNKKVAADAVIESSSVVDHSAEEHQSAESEHQYRYPPIDNTGKLFLRLFFKNPEKGDKTITKLRGKVYFPRNPNIEPGWYVTTIVEEQESFGIMDTMALTEVPKAMWDPKFILGIFVKKNFSEGTKEIYRALPKDRLETDDSPCIFTVPLEEADSSAKASIQDIINAKKEELGL